MNDHYSVSELCEAFDVSRSGYHAWSTRAPSARDQDDAQLAPLIAAAHTEGRREYDSPRVMRWLQKRGHHCGRRRIGRLMRQLGLSQRKRRRFKPVSLTDSNHDLPVAPNLLSHRRPTLQPNAVWLADITYVPTDEGWLYVAGVLDRCTCRCIIELLSRAPRLARPSSNGSKSFTTGRGSTARSATNPLWTLKLNLN